MAVEKNTADWMRLLTSRHHLTVLLLCCGTNAARVLFWTCAGAVESASRETPAVWRRKRNIRGG
jgi:hypothetical protein